MAVKHSGLRVLTTFLFILGLFACSELPESSLATPDNRVAPDNAKPQDDVDAIAAQSPGDKGKLSVKILVTDCIIQHVSRVYHLTAIHPKSATPDFYDSRRYEIRWYGGDGRTISESVTLECVAGGTYYVEVTDRVTNDRGRARVTL
ncbi:MAG: hypothetical protein R3330_16840 [Saprospiraceae bacterium]|nr:hypothetical protein [Saprospiraceae bacterium]